MTTETKVNPFVIPPKPTMADVRVTTRGTEAMKILMLRLREDMDDYPTFYDAKKNLFTLTMANVEKLYSLLTVYELVHSPLSPLVDKYIRMTKKRINGAMTRELTALNNYRDKAIVNVHSISSDTSTAKWEYKFSTTSNRRPGLVRMGAFNVADRMPNEDDLSFESRFRRPKFVHPIMVYFDAQEDGSCTVVYTQDSKQGSSEISCATLDEAILEAIQQLMYVTDEFDKYMLHMRDLAAQALKDLDQSEAEVEPSSTYTEDEYKEDNDNEDWIKRIAE